MPGKSTLKAHADLVDRMADAVGVDLEQAMMEGRMSFDQLGDAVLACTGCSNPEDCERWLDQHSDGAESAPGYCRNQETFRRLRDGKHA